MNAQQITDGAKRPAREAIPDSILTVVAGNAYHASEDMYPGVPIHLVRKPENHDHANATAVFNVRGRKIG